MDKIHDGIGDKVGLLIQWIATFVGGFVVAFISEWRLTLFLLSFTPFLGIVGLLMARVSSVEKKMEDIIIIVGCFAGYQCSDQCGAERVCISWGCS